MKQPRDSLFIPRDSVNSSEGEFQGDDQVSDRMVNTDGFGICKTDIG